MKRILSAILLLISVSAYANDGVYFTSGNFLVPMRESTISVRKEILTITIGKDNLAMVDVYYEFYNPDSTKTVSMAFEAAAPYNADFDFSKSTKHPYIHNFKVMMNGKPLKYKNMLIPRLDSFVSADYGYMFEATFQPGINTVHHTYSYNMSFGIDDTYSIHYWLTPATRWANHQIDDFTLRVKNENGMDYCFSYDSLFSAAPYIFTKGNGSIFPFTDEHGVHNTLIAAHCEDALLEWHARDFAPEDNLCIKSIDNFINLLNPNFRGTQGNVVVTSDSIPCRFIGYSGDNYLVDAQDYGLIPVNEAKVEMFTAEAGQGIVTIRNKEFKSVNVRMQPSMKSAVVTKIRDQRGELPVVLKCLGLVNDIEKNEYGFSDYRWFKVEVNGKTGYIREDLMIWDSIDTY